MQVVQTIDELRQVIRGWRSQQQRIAFVPTMGNLHDGHLQLVQRAGQLAERVVCSIFVNPMQFGPNEDFERYPRTHEADISKLEQQSCDLLFLPEVSDIYPQDLAQQTRVEVPGLSDILCGVSRPGHFVGVTTVVCKLFNMVQPDVAVFGEKDFQQLLLIRRMTADLCLPIEIVGAPIVRESDGLAMSSRNAYLDAPQRAKATVLYQMLQQLQDAMLGGETNYAALQQQAIQQLQQQGFDVDYVEIRNAENLQVPQPQDRELVILLAARVGSTRLIDNLQVSLPIATVT
ncbi:MAG: pantoate--beta-alanine ligase [Chromatiales bacterium]|jgi:pantoate--beta-alanine ligase